MSRSPIVILSAGGTGLDMLDFIDDLNAEAERFELIGFLDDNPALQAGSVAGYPILGPLDRAAALPPAVRFIDALGSPRSYRARPGVIDRLGLTPDRFASLVHPAARVSRRAELGPGSLLYPLVSVNAGVRLGAHSIVLANSSLNHHVTLGDYTIVTSNVAVSGHVQIGRCCYIGTGSCLMQGISIGDGALIGMGSVVRHNVPNQAVAYGNPAHIRQQKV